MIVVEFLESVLNNIKGSTLFEVLPYHNAFI